MKLNFESEERQDEKLDSALEYWLIGQNLKRKTAFVIKVESKIFSSS